VSSFPLVIFVSSVQKELAAERRAVKAFIESDPLLHRFFTVFLFEDLPATDRKADDVYLAEVDRCTVYLGLFGNEYGFEDAEGVSPTEREFMRATEQAKHRLVFIKGADDAARHTKMGSLIRQAGNQLIRRRFTTAEELIQQLHASLVDYLDSCGVIQDRPFEERARADATLDDLDAQAVARFVGVARGGRQFPLPADAPVRNVLTHLHLLGDGAPTNAALLLFASDPQRFIAGAEVRCMHFHGTEVQRPAPSYQVYKGTVFTQVDRAVDFVLSVLHRSVGTRAESSQAPGQYEIPPDVVREAIVNAVAHRDYASAGVVQVSVFADRVEVWNPGALPPPLTLDSLRHPHGSYARNPRLCEGLFLAQYIEKYGTGTLMMIRESLESALPEPDFAQRGGEFTVVLWRDWLTDEVLAGFDLNERQRQAITYVKAHGSISNSEYQQVASTNKKTATRDLGDMKTKGIIEQRGERGPNVHYVIAKQGDKMGSLGT
jgi:predicted HTH transcriptional regulator